MIPTGHYDNHDHKYHHDIHVFLLFLASCQPASDYMVDKRLSLLI